MKLQKLLSSSNNGKMMKTKKFQSMLEDNIKPTLNTL